MALSCKLSNVSGQDLECKKTAGGIQFSYGVSWKDIDQITVAGGVITAITLKSGKFLNKIEFDDDNTANYNQEGTRENNNFVVNQNAFMKFTGTSNEMIVKANEFKGVRNGFFIHILTDGTRASQGAELSADGTKAIKSIQSAKVNPNVNSNTGDAASAIEFNIVATSSDFLPVASALDLETLVEPESGS